MELSFLQKIKSRLAYRRFQQEQDRLNGRRAGPSFLFVYLPIIVGVIGFIFLWYQYTHLNVSTYGVVQRSWIEDDTPILNRFRSSAFFHVDWRYKAVLEITYVVNGSKFRSKYHGHSFWSKSEAIQFLNQHPEGSAMQVYYDPDNPNEFTFGRSLWSKWLLLFVLVAFSLFSRALFFR